MSASKKSKTSHGEEADVGSVAAESAGAVDSASEKKAVETENPADIFNAKLKEVIARVGAEGAMTIVGIDYGEDDDDEEEGEKASKPAAEGEKEKKNPTEEELAQVRLILVTPRRGKLIDAMTKVLVPEHDDSGFLMTTTKDSYPAVAGIKSEAFDFKI